MLQLFLEFLELFNAFWENRFGEFSQIWITCNVRFNQIYLDPSRLKQNSLFNDKV